MKTLAGIGLFLFLLYGLGLLVADTGKNAVTIASKIKKKLRRK